MTYFSKNFSRFVLSTCALCLVGFAAHGEERLSDAWIEEFYAQSTEVQRLSSNVTIEFMDRHIHDDAKAKMTTITTLPGLPPQKDDREFTKQELLDQAREGQSMSQLESLENELISIGIAKDGRSASVKERSVSTFVVDVPTPDGQKMQMKSKQTTNCDTRIKLNQQNVIQVHATDCIVEAEIVPNF
ncbi:MAG: hypothetical protein GC137_00720 [Alphaproteobacteria bacterium]|nr:hypothetical protein [Alphaproteobacteria bacterium]